jgi:hypothetical protein
MLQEETMHDQPPARRPVEVVRQVDQPPVPTAALVLDSLGRMHPAVAITVVLTTAGLAVGGVVAVVALVVGLLATVAAIVGTVAIAGLGLGVAAIVLGGRQAAPTR